MEVMILGRPISRLYCVWFYPLGTVSLFSGKDGTYGLDILEEFTTFELGIINNNISKWTELKNIYVVLPLLKQPSVSGTEMTQPSVKHHQVIFGTTYIVMRAPQKWGQSMKLPSTSPRIPGSQTVSYDSLDVIAGSAVTLQIQLNMPRCYFVLSDD